MEQRIGGASRTRRTQAERRDESGRGLVQGAISVVAQDGVSAATFEAIGRRSGYHRSLVTQRFGSKQGLIDAIIENSSHRLDQILAERRTEDMSGLDGLIAYCDIYLRELAESSELRAYFLLLSSAVADLSPLRDAFAAQHQRVKRRLASYLAKGQAEGEIRQDIDVEAAALMIGSLQLGLSMQLLVDPTMDLEPIRQTSLAALRRSLAGR